MFTFMRYLLNKFALKTSVEADRQRYRRIVESGRSETADQLEQLTAWCAQHKSDHGKKPIR